MSAVFLHPVPTSDKWIDDTEAQASLKQYTVTAHSEQSVAPFLNKTQQLSDTVSEIMHMFDNHWRKKRGACLVWLCTTKWSYNPLSVLPAVWGGRGVMPKPGSISEEPIQRTSLRLDKRCDRWSENLTEL